jgi:hypothetical protein
MNNFEEQFLQEYQNPLLPIFLNLPIEISSNEITIPIQPPVISDIQIDDLSFFPIANDEKEDIFPEIEVSSLSNQTSLGKSVRDKKEKIQIPSQKLERIKDNFTGKDTISSIVLRIKTFNNTGHLILPNEFLDNILEAKLYCEYPIPLQKELPILSIIEQTSSLSSRLFQAGIDSQCNFENVCGIIAIECGQTLSPENKLASIFLAVSLANAYSMLEIPYSVVVFADFNFQYIIKTFEEPHSPHTLQRIIDSVMVDRFAPKIADVCYFIKLKLFY